MKQININIKSAAFPDQFATDKQKATDEFGLQVGQAIQYEWFRKDGVGCRFYSQWTEFHRLRLYARGEQSVAKYKNELMVCLIDYLRLTVLLWMLCHLKKEININR